MLLWLLLARPAVGVQTAPSSLLVTPTPLSTLSTPLAVSGAASPLATLLDVPVAHNARLPSAFSTRMGGREKAALSFLLSYLETHSLPAQILLSGGYVRDLLLGLNPVDLDVSLCLRECEASMTVSTLVEALPSYAASHPSLGVTHVAHLETLSEAAKAKSVSAAKLRFDLAGGEVICVDLMPTIGAEVYDEKDRIPTRDVRGTVQEDALRQSHTLPCLDPPARA